MKSLFLITASVLMVVGTSAFRLSSSQSITVPAVVRDALAKKYPHVKLVNWEKEKGNFEGNWGGNSKEDTSVLFTPAGDFVEEVIAINVFDLPAAIESYVKANYSGAKIKEAGRVTDAKGIKMFEAEIKGKELIFDESGKFLKKD